MSIGANEPKDLSNMVVRFFLGRENAEERFRLLTEFLGKTGIHRVIFFSAFFAETGSFQPLDNYSKQASHLRSYMEKLRGMGIDVGVNMLFTVGHCFYPEEPTDSELCFRRAVTVDGEPSRGCACMADERLWKYIKEEYRIFAALKPSVIFFDDDIRMSSLGKTVCFCDEHLKRYSRRVGRKITREEIKSALLSDKFGENALKKAYFDEAAENTEQIFRMLADAVHEISPETELGIMTTTYPIVTLDKDLSLLFRRNEDRKIRYIRTGMDFYREGEHNKIPAAFTMPAIQRELINDGGVEIQPEIENDTYGYFYKSNAVTNMQLVWCLISGFRNMQLNLFEPFSGHPQNAEEIITYLTGKMPYYNAIATAVPEGHRTEGIGIYAHPRALLGNRGKDGDMMHDAAWHGWLQLLGLPYTSDTRNTDFIFLTQDDVYMATDAEILSLLGKGAVIDLRAAEALCARGFGNTVGIAAISDLSEPIAGEHFTDAAENGEWQNCRNSDYLMSTLVGKSDIKKVTYLPGAEILSYFVNPRGEKIADGVAITENAEGKRFCILPIGTTVFTAFTHVNPKRRLQLINAFETVAGKRLPIVAENEKTVVLSQRLGTERIVTLCNLSSDPVKPKLRYMPQNRLTVLRDDGKFHRLSYRTENRFCIFDTELPAFGVLTFKDSADASLRNVLIFSK